MNYEYKLWSDGAIQSINQLFFFIVEPEPEKDSNVFRHPQDFTLEQQGPSSTNSTEFTDNVDSTSSLSTKTSRKGTRKTSQKKKTKRTQNIGGASNLDEDEELEEAMRMSLEQSMLEEEMRRKENEAISKAINESMSAVGKDLINDATPEDHSTLS